MCGAMPMISFSFSLFLLVHRRTQRRQRELSWILRELFDSNSNHSKDGAGQNERCVGDRVEMVIRKPLGYPRCEPAVRGGLFHRRVLAANLRRHDQRYKGEVPVPGNSLQFFSPWFNLKQ